MLENKIPGGVLITFHFDFFRFSKSDSRLSERLRDSRWCGCRVSEQSRVYWARYLRKCVQTRDGGDKDICLRACSHVDN